MHLYFNDWELGLLIDGKFGVLQLFVIKKGLGGRLHIGIVFFSIFIRRQYRVSAKNQLPIFGGFISWRS